MEPKKDKALPKLTGAVSGSLSLLHLRVAHVCSGNKDIRYYLNGLQFEIHPGPKPLVLTIATDGHRLLVCRHEDSSGITGAAAARFHLERDQVEQVLTAFKRYERTLPVVMFTLNHDTNMVEITGAGNTRLVFPSSVDAANAFPCWRRIMAGLKPNGEPGQFKPDYLCDCARIARMVNRKPLLHVEHNGREGTARITFGDDNIAMALMPYRLRNPSATDWLGEIAAPATWSRA